MTTLTAKRIVILSSNAGGGHMASAEAIRDALESHYGQRVSVRIIDTLKEYAPQPFDKTSEAYSIMIRSPQFWQGFYDMGDGPRRAQFINRSLALYARRGSLKLLEEHPADLFISTYSFASAPVLQAMAKLKLTTPFITVVTDIVTIPPIWFDQRTTLCFVPTEEAREQAVINGIELSKLTITGLPVSKRFFPASAPKAQLKGELGWNPRRPAILVMAGGQGVGPLGRIATALAPLNATIIIICGKNTSLHESLAAKTWPDNVLVQGFVGNMPDYMRAADLIVTKAGPSTIMEALNTHVPLMLYARLPGQEEGNVDFVVSRGAGVWTPDLDHLAATAALWLQKPELLQHFARGAALASAPDAAHTIALAVGQTLELPEHAA